MDVERTENGLYKVAQPMGGQAPDEIALTQNGVTYVFSEFAGRSLESRAFPDVLTYEELTIVEES
jgi:hypothetical protein